MVFTNGVGHVGLMHSIQSYAEYTLFTDDIFVFRDLPIVMSGFGPSICITDSIAQMIVPGFGVGPTTANEWHVQCGGVSTSLQTHNFPDHYILWFPDIPWCNSCPRPLHADTRILGNRGDIISGIFIQDTFVLGFYVLTVMLVVAATVLIRS